VSTVSESAALVLLMAELEKMKRTAAKVIPGAPHDVLLVLDATTGQNGLAQAREFTSTVGVTELSSRSLTVRQKAALLSRSRANWACHPFRWHR